jgi:hypothetical protein
VLHIARADQLGELDKLAHDLAHMAAALAQAAPIPADIEARGVTAEALAPARLAAGS